MKQIQLKLFSDSEVYNPPVQKEPEPIENTVVAVVSKVIQLPLFN